MRFLCFVAFSNPKIDRQPFGQIAPPYNHGQYTTKPLKKSTESAKQVLLPKKFVWFYQILPLDFGDIASRVSCDGAGGERRGGRFFERKLHFLRKWQKTFCRALSVEVVRTYCAKWGIAMFALTLWQARDRKFCGAFSKATSPVVLPSPDPSQLTQEATLPNAEGAFCDIYPKM